MTSSTPAAAASRSTCLRDTRDMLPTTKRIGPSAGGSASGRRGRCSPAASGRRWASPAEPTQIVPRPSGTEAAAMAPRSASVSASQTIASWPA